MQDIVEILKIIASRPIEEMTLVELRKAYEDMLNVMIGMMIGSRFTTGQIKEIMKKKKE